MNRATDEKDYDSMNDDYEEYDDDNDGDDNDGDDGVEDIDNDSTCSESKNEFSRIPDKKNRMKFVKVRK